MAVKELYFGLWSQMSGWPVTQRAAVVLGVISIIVYLLFMPFYWKICSLSLAGLNLICKAVYILLYNGMEAVLRNKTQKERAESLNYLSEKMERLSDWLLNRSKELKKKKKPSLFYMFALYAVLIGWISLPSWVGQAVNEKYIPLLSYGTQIYQNCERSTLETAKQYPPLLKESGRVVNQASVSALETKKEQWMSLSEDGKGGANVREQPTTKSRSLTTVSGEDTVLYLEQTDGWVYVQLKDGTKGWIREYLLEEVPE